VLSIGETVDLENHHMYTLVGIPLLLIGKLLMSLVFRKLSIFVRVNVLLVTFSDFSVHPQFDGRGVLDSNW
jgi:hypothetical protein